MIAIAEDWPFRKKQHVLQNDFEQVLESYSYHSLSHWIVFMQVLYLTNQSSVFGILSRIG